MADRINQWVPYTHLLFSRKPDTRTLAVLDSADFAMDVFRHDREYKQASKRPYKLIDCPDPRPLEM